MRPRRRLAAAQAPCTAPSAVWAADGQRRNKAHFCRQAAPIRSRIPMSTAECRRISRRRRAAMGIKFTPRLRTRAGGGVATMLRILPGFTKTRLDRVGTGSEEVIVLRRRGAMRQMKP